MNTDIQSNHPVINILPAPLRPYAILARLDRPIGIWLLLLPSLWGIALASNGIWDARTIKMITLFSLGAVIMRAAGCVINDLWDRTLDTHVARTASRPIASGKISIKQGAGFLGVLLLCGFLILIQMNLLTIILGVFTLPLIIAYPLMKRITWWPQAFLGITFNAGAVMGYTTITGRIEFECLALYVAGIFWTLGYDTVYAHQDIEDDIMAGIKSTARKFGAYSKTWVSGFYAMTITCLSASFAVATLVPYSPLYLLPAAIHMAYQIKIWDTKNPQSALRVFKLNRDFGFLVLAGILATQIL